MRCEDLAERLTALMEGTLDPRDEEVALDHLSSCPSCERVLADTRAAGEEVHQVNGIALIIGVLQ